MPFATKSQKQSRSYSYNPGTRMGPQSLDENGMKTRSQKCNLSIISLML